MYLRARQAQHAIVTLRKFAPLQHNQTVTAVYDFNSTGAIREQAIANAGGLRSCGGLRTPLYSSDTKSEKRTMFVKNPAFGYCGRFMMHADSGVSIPVPRNSNESAVGSATTPQHAL